jgi:DNA/RNA endonuclease G (NUC1)
MIRSFLTGLVLAFVASGVLAQTACPQLFAGGQPPAAADVELLCHIDYAIGFSAAWLDPAWSAEHLTAEQAREGMSYNRKSGGDFHAEDLLPPAQRVTKGDYTRSRL